MKDFLTTNSADGRGCILGTEGNEGKEGGEAAEVSREDAKARSDGAVVCPYCYGETRLFRVWPGEPKFIPCQCAGADR